MAFAVARKDGRYEIRESIATPKGPRARTLAVFSLLTDAVLDRAQNRATTFFDRRAVLQRVRALGARYVADNDSAALLSLIAKLRAQPGHDGAWRTALRCALGDADSGELPDSIPPLLDWVGVDDAERGSTLRELLDFADRVQSARLAPRSTGLKFPRIVSRPVSEHVR